MAPINELVLDCVHKESLFNAVDKSPGIQIDCPLILPS